MKWNKLITLIILVSLFAYIAETEKRISRSFASGTLQSLSIDSLQSKAKNFLHSSLVADGPDADKSISVISLLH